MPRQYFDKLDLTILNALCENARTPYLEIAREYGVSGAAVHQRVQRLIASKVITGSHCDIDPLYNRLSCGGLRRYMRQARHRYPRACAAARAD